MKNRILSGRGVLAALLTTTVLAAALTAAPPGKNNAPGNSGNANGNGRKSAVTAYGGQAIALRVDGVTQPVSGPIVICDTGLLPTSGGVLEQAEGNVNIAAGGLTLDAASAQVMGVGPEASADTTLTNYHAEFVSDEGVHVTFDADYIHASAAATIQPNGSIALQSHVDVQNLVVNGLKIAVTGEPNQRVEIPGTECWLVINEQAAMNGDGSGDIGVTAIHFDVCHCIEGHIGFLHAGISGQRSPGEEHDCGKITGGGWIVTPTGAKGTFGVSGGVRRGEFWGHLTYIDHGTGTKVESTAVTGFENDPTDANGRIVTYAVTIDGVAGTARVRLVDNGEPGRDDLFEIALSNGYRAGGDLGGANAGGGNIQLHKCPPGWE